MTRACLCETDTPPAAAPPTPPRPPLPPLSAMGKYDDSDSDLEQYNNPLDPRSKSYTGPKPAQGSDNSDNDEEMERKESSSSPRKKAASSSSASSKASPSKKKASYLSTEQEEEDDWNTQRNEAAEAAALQAQLNGTKAPKRRRIATEAEREAARAANKNRAMYQMEGQSSTRTEHSACKPSSSG